MKRQCVDCGAILTGHNNPQRCRSCGIKRGYVDRHGSPPAMLEVKCGICEKPIREYLSNHRKSKSGKFFCSEICRREWVRYYLSVSCGGDGVKRSKPEKDALDYIKHSDKRKARARRYYTNFPDRVKAHGHRRRARIAGNGGTYSEAEWETLKAQYNYRCPKCGKSEPEITLSVDHITPIAKGGDNFITNIQPLCLRCNKKKHTRTLKYEPWLAESKGSPEINFEVVLCQEREGGERG